MYLPRSLKSSLEQRLAEYPVVILTGPRQAGKSTLLLNHYQDSYGYVSLDDLSQLEIAHNDPRAFLEDHPSPVIIDEIQHAPELLPYIRQVVDSNPERMGQYILAGSESIEYSAQVSDLLADHSTTLDLYPFTLRELRRQPERLLPWQRNRVEDATQLHFDDDLLIQGLYPQPALSQAYSQVWQGEHIRTCIERDVRALRNVSNLTLFQRFLRLLAERNAQQLNMTDIANHAGLTVNTIKKWIAVLEATFHVLLLPPYDRNAGKRLRKAKKVYFTDSGTASWLLGVRDAQQMQLETIRGGLFESFVITEILKTIAHRGDMQVSAHYWRTEHGLEVDLVLDYGAELIPVEVKPARTARQEWVRNLQAFMKDYPEAQRGFVIYRGDATVRLAEDITAVPVSML